MKTNNARFIPIAILLSLLTLTPAHATADFTISANPSNLGRVFATSHRQSTITVTSTGGFSGTVNLTATAPTGVTTSFNPTSITVTSGGSGTSTLTITFPDCPFGNSPLYVYGTSGSLQHYTTVAWGIVVC